jgi:glycosyltransferase involved in cell wall biosynthesis
MIESVFVLMPACHAAKTIEGVFARIPEEARRRVRHYVVVNDGSADDTAAALDRLRARWPNLDVLDADAHRGYGAAVKMLLWHAVSEGAGAAVLLHPDAHCSPECILDLLGPLDAGVADIAQGSHVRGGIPAYKLIASKALTAIENRAFGLHLAEYHSGHMAYTRAAQTSISYERLSDSFDFDLEMIVMARARGLRIAEAPIPAMHAGEVWRTLHYGMSVLRVARDYRRGKYV